METDEGMLGVAEKVLYEGLEDIKEAMAYASVLSSLEDTPLAAPSGSDTV